MFIYFWIRVLCPTQEHFTYTTGTNASIMVEGSLEVPRKTVPICRSVGDLYKC